MKKIGIVALLGLITAGVGPAGCSGGSDVSCDEKISTIHFCALYTNLTSDQETTVKSSCTGATSTVGTSCPSANAVGTCTVTSGGVSAEETFYSDGGTTAAAAQSACTTGGGTWTGA